MILITVCIQETIEKVKTNPLKIDPSAPKITMQQKMYGTDIPLYILQVVVLIFVTV